MKCNWCGNESTLRNPVGGMRYCSKECEHAAELYAFEQFDAQFHDHDPPTKTEIDCRIRAAKRWTPDKMKRRVQEFEEIMQS